MSQKQRLIEYWTSSGIIKDKKVIEAFKKVPREAFLKDRKEGAYGDYPLPIEGGQTISQPTTVMIMTEALELKKGHKVLEIGSGSGYQAAIISKIIGNGGKLISTEIIPELAEFARNNIRKLKIKNIEIIKRDGSKGYAKAAPYDRIIVTAASPEIPRPLIRQLKENGIIIAPVGNLVEQMMIKGIKKGSRLIKEEIGQFMFVPLKGK
ncbi:MAG TPA: protein-L-isoaspartate(D-aspartate) O-methyltransferase [Candidatus Nanoarchaeia archaeon]|nr:protein-L-isoaspartate(D-aspartate) O-methyltransferase [Candidatus Nanoarchaeia archaeon]